jgi:hypothetical protein
MLFAYLARQKGQPVVGQLAVVLDDYRLSIDD